MGFEDELEENRARLEKLKANVHVCAIRQYIDELKRKWHPSTKLIEGPIHHGSKKDDISESTLYWDVVNAKWTDKESAFRAYLMRKLEGMMVDPLSY